jgi:hypothetical protein
MQPSGRQHMPKMTQQDEIHLKVTASVVKSFAQTLKLDYSEISLLALDGLAFFVPWRPSPTDRASC